MELLKSFLKLRKKYEQSQKIVLLTISMLNCIKTVYKALSQDQISHEEIMR